MFDSEKLNREVLNNEETFGKKTKLTKKPYYMVSPINNDSKLEEKNKIKEYLNDIKKPVNGKQIGGIPLLYDDSTVYVDTQDSHSLIIGSTGSKKTRLVVLPLVKILGYAEESMIICDPKAEVYNRTACSLKNAGYKIEVVNFRNPSVGECWNPLEIPYRLFCLGDIDRACEFVNDIATNLMLAETFHDPYWDYSAADLFFGLTLLTFTLKKDVESVSISDVLELRRKMFLENGQVNSYYQDMAKQNSLIYHSLIGTMNVPEKTQSCILSTFDQKMRCFVYQQNLTNMMAHNTVSLDSIGYEKTIVYLIMPDEKTTYHKLISLFIKQSYEYLIYKIQENNIENGFNKRINYILDEFSTLPTIKDFPNMITAARSRNIRFNLVIQSLHQLKSRYGDEAETIKANCNNWIYLTSRELELLREISELCGMDASYRPIFSISALQHLDKNKGQALILCGRLFPFISELKDISSYDNEHYDVLPYTHRDQSDIFFSIPQTHSQAIKVESLDDLFEDEPIISPNNKQNISLNDEVEDNVKSDLQKELEKKFDELFGPLDDD